MRTRYYPWWPRVPNTRLTRTVAGVGSVCTALALAMLAFVAAVLVLGALIGLGAAIVGVDL